MYVHTHTSQHMVQRMGFIKPIFHCNPKPIAFGLCIGCGPQCERFMLLIPTCWYLKSLANPKQSLADPTQSIPDPTCTHGPIASPTQAGLIGSPHFGVCISHVDFMLFVSISFALGSQRKRNSWWNMGFRLHDQI